MNDPTFPASPDGVIQESADGQVTTLTDGLVTTEGGGSSMNSGLLSWSTQNSLGNQVTSSKNAAPFPSVQIQELR